jgi:hypothetical protein
MGMVKPILNDGDKLVACGLFIPQSGESIRVRIEFAAIGPQREEEHSGVSCLDCAELLVSRTVISQEPSVRANSVSVIDMGECPDSLEQSRFVTSSTSSRESGFTAQSGPAPVPLEDIAELQSGLVEKLGQ